MAGVEKRDTPKPSCMAGAAIWYEWRKAQFYEERLDFTELMHIPPGKSDLNSRT